MSPTSLAVIGLGAIGGSVAWQARRAGIKTVIGFSPETADLDAAREAGALTATAPNPEAAVRGAEFIVIAAPPAATLELLDRLAPLIPAGTVITDVASVKAPVVARALKAGLAGRFAGGHPLAGTHASGWSAARADRFRDCVVYVTPTGPLPGDAAAQAVVRFWAEVMQAHPVLMTAEAHDRQLAWTSHLPQAVAYALALTLAARGLEPDAFGPGAKGTTRLAASQPDLWIEIFLQNRDAVLAALDAAVGDLGALRDAVARRDEARLRVLFATAQRFRESLDA
jgi:prephenate dehydrogenase